MRAVQPAGPRSDDWWCELTVGHAAGASRARATQARRAPFGWMLLTPEAPLVWAVNRAQVVPNAGGLDAAETVTAVEAAHDAAGLAHRAVDLRGRGDARRLAPVLRAAGYVVQELHVLAAAPAELAERTRPRPGRSYVVAPEGPEAAEPVRQAAEEGQDRTPEERRQVARQWSLAPARDTVHLVARDAAGEAVGSLVVHLASLHLELDDVLTHPARERAGVGTALLAAAAELGRRRDVGRLTLLADPNDYAASWYGRRGFRAVGRTATAHRVPAA